MTTSRRTPARKPATRTAAVAKAAAAVAAPRKTPSPAKAPKAGKPAAKAPPAGKPAKEGKADKARKPKLVRDSFTMPKDEYAVIDTLKQRGARLGRPSKKSEVLRAGVKALQAMADDAFLACLAGVPSIKTGRPARA